MTANLVLQTGEPKKKAAVEKSMSLFGQSLPFTQAFPMLANVQVTVRVRPHGKTEENPQERHFRLGNPPREHLNCPIPTCTNGGWALGRFIRDMIAKRETHRQVEGNCSGQRRMAGSQYQSCPTHFTAEIELTYKPVEVPAAPPSSKKSLLSLG